MKDLSLTLGILFAAIAGSFCGPVCRANDKHDLPDAPSPIVNSRNGRETSTVFQCASEPQGPSAQPQAISKSSVKSPDRSGHRFWDRENVALFSLVGAARALDYSSTLNMRRRGRQEVLLTNEVVDNHPAFAVIEAAGTAVSMGASYLFHRYQHHRLERWTSIIHASLTTTGAVRNYCLRTAHPSTMP